MEHPRMRTLLLSLLVTSVTSSQIDCFLDHQKCEATADTLIKVFMDINTTEECLGFCNDHNSCTAFTHFGSTSEPFSLACFLYSSCRSRVPCSNCTTGSTQVHAGVSGVQVQVQVRCRLTHWLQFFK